MRRLALVPVALLAWLVSSSVEAAAPAASKFVVQVPAAARVQSLDSAREALARHAAISGHVQLSEHRTTRVGQATIYKFRQTVSGIPVMGRGAAIAVQPDGSVLLATARTESRLPVSVVPKLDAQQAALAAAARSGLAPNPQLARLLIFPTATGGRLAWKLRDRSLFPLPYVPEVIVDAETGAVLAFQNAVLFKNKANLHKYNPVSTPQLTEVELPIPEPNVSPDNEDVRSFNCIDTKTLKPVDYGGFKLNLHVCEIASMTTPPESAAYPGQAFADPDAGDFLQTLGDGETQGGDPFAELSVFYHTTQAYDYFRTLEPGFKLSEQNKAWPLYVVANVMMPSGLSTMNIAQMQDPNAALEPLSNAMYTGWDEQGFGDMLSAIAPEIKGAALAFGQGVKVDWGLDGDVVFHEFGHAVVDSTAGLVGYWHLDSQGASVSPGGMNEGIADFFAAAITSDPKTGEYACQDVHGMNCEGIRVLTNDKTCPAWLTGEVHADAEFFSAPMWSVRAGLADDAERKTFDQALLTTLNTVSSGDLGYEDLAEAFVKALEKSPLGATVAAKMTEQYTARGVLPRCHRLLTWEGKAISSKSSNMAFSFSAAGTQELMPSAQAEYAPGLMQIKVALPAGTSTMTATITELKTSAANPLKQGSAFKPAFLVGFDKEIEFDPTDLTANTSTLVDATGSSTKWSAPIDVPAGAQEAYVMIVNKGQRGGLYKTITFGFEISDAGLEQPDAEPEADASEEAGAPVVAEAEKSDDGCGCRAAGSRAPGGAAAALLALASILLARRRR
jgi:MYXO-CTERM domain-containing protein